MSDTFQAQWQTERAKWCDARQVQVHDSFGDLPRMQSGDVLALLAPWTAQVRLHITAHNAPLFDGAIIINAGGAKIPTTTTLDISEASTDSSVDVDDYMMHGIPGASADSRRVPVQLIDGVTSYFVATPNWDNGDIGPDVVSRWQSLVESTASVLKVSALLDRSMSDTEVRAVWNSAWNLAVALDIAAEHPTPTLWGGIKASARETLDSVESAAQEGANIAGQAAREIAGQAGAIGSSFLQGLLGDMFPIAIAAGAIYVAIHYGIV